MSVQQKAVTGPNTPKVRVYQTQSRLIGLHASCAIVVAQITGCVSPRFTHKPQPVSKRVREGQPAFSGEEARLAACELCEFRAMQEKHFVALYKILMHAKTAIQISEDRTLTLAQLEIMEFVRVERLNVKLEREKSLADKQFLRSEREKRANSPLVASLVRRCEEIRDAMRPEVPPIRDTRKILTQKESHAAKSKLPPMRKMTQEERTTRAKSDHNAIMSTPLKHGTVSEKLARKLKTSDRTLSPTAFKQAVIGPMRETTAQKLDRTDPVLCPVCEAKMQRGVGTWPNCPNCGHDVSGPERKTITDARGQSRVRKPAPVGGKARTHAELMLSKGHVVRVPEGQVSLDDAGPKVFKATPLAQPTVAHIPEKASVVWLQAEYNTLARFKGKLSDTQKMRAKQLREALKARGIEV